MTVCASVPTPERPQPPASAAVEEKRRERRAEAYELRAKLRPLAVNRRIAECGCRTLTETPELVIRDYAESRRAWWEGIMTCGRQFACPVCASRKAAERRDEIMRLESDCNGRWQMVTLTLQHNASQSLFALLDSLMGGWRKVRRKRAIEKIFKRRVTASIRALEVKHGRKNGWHPHIHLLLRTSHWSDEDRATLEREWLSVVDGKQGIAVKWSEPFAGSEIQKASGKKRVAYLAKLGAELTGVCKESADENGNLTSWQVARRALEEPRYARLWREFQEAMRGRRILEFDERAKALVVPDVDTEEFLREWRIVLNRDEYEHLARFERKDPAILWLIVETALHAGPDPPELVEDAITDVLRWGRRADAPLRRARPRTLELAVSFVPPVAS